MRFPKHKCGLTLEHNPHKTYYERIEDYIEQRDLVEDFETSDQLQRALNTDELWVLQWFPRTPVGSYVVAAPTLDECLARANFSPKEELDADL